MGPNSESHPRLLQREFSHLKQNKKIKFSNKSVGLDDFCDLMTLDSKPLIIYDSYHHLHASNFLFLFFSAVW